MKKMVFMVNSKQQAEKTIEFNCQRLIAVGFAGRNQAKAWEHIKELQEIGVTAPESIPVLYPCSTSLVSQNDSVEVVGGETSGEVEFVILVQDESIYIGLGSDHTDRSLEAVSIAKSKQICSKPISREIWTYADIYKHWDEIELISWQTKDGQEEVYQRGSVKELLPVDDIIAEVKKTYPELNNAIIFAGTVPTLQGFVYGDDFRCELLDPVLNRSLKLQYRIQQLSARAAAGAAAGPIISA